MQRERKIKREKLSEEDDILRLDEVMAVHIRCALELIKGKIEGAGGVAERLGIHPSALRERTDMHWLF